MVRFKVEGLRRLMADLNRIGRLKRYADAETVVSYGNDPVTERYAVYVHEDLTQKTWTRKGSGPKFLEAPSRRMMPRFSGLVFAKMRSGKGMGQAVYEAGQELKRDSQEVVPIDTQALHDSARVRRAK